MLDLLRVSPTGLLLPGQMFAPVSALRVDWTHPMAFGLKSVVVPDLTGEVIDLAVPRKTPGSVRGLRARGPTVRGGSWVMSNAATPDLDFTAAPHSAAAIGYINSTGASDNISFLARYNFVSGANNQGWAITTNANSNFASFIFNNNGSTSLSSTGAAPAVGEWMVGHSEDGTTRRIYVNGAFNNSATGLNHTSPTCTTGTGYTTESTRFDLYIGAAWARVLTDAEMLQFYADPFCFLTCDSLQTLRAAGGAATRGLFIPPLLNGLGAGGSFFNNRLG